MNRFILIGFLFLSSLVPIVVMAQEKTASTHSAPIVVHMFTRDDCGFCKKQTVFLETLSRERTDFVVEFHNLKNPEDQALFVRFAESQSLPKVTPLTVVGRTVLQGFDAPEGTGARLIAAIERAKQDPPISLETVMGAGPDEVIGDATSGCEGEVCDATAGPGGFVFKLPFIGVVNLTEYSLPMLAALLGFVDGFNPCAMWVLITFLLILMQVGDRKRMMQVAGLFIVAEAVMYTLILNVWYHAWDFVGLDKIVTPIVGVVAIGGGVYFLYRWNKARTSPLVCEVTDIDQQMKIEQKIRHFASAPMTIAVALGVIGLALSVNIIEFACSIGIPQAFTKIIELNQLGFLKTQLYMGIYTLMYMIDDLIVFGIALWGFNKLHQAGQKYSKWSLFIGGVLMLILGTLLVADPSLLVI